MSKNRSSIKVGVRVKPNSNLIDEEIISINKRNELVIDGNSTKPTIFSFPNAIISGSSQTESFDSLASDLLSKLHEGYSCTLIAYGQTGSGKTYTMFGPPGCLTETNLSKCNNGEIPDDWGIFPRTCLDLLLLTSNTSESFSLVASALEIYQDKVYDLLNDSANIVIGREVAKKKHDINCCCKECCEKRIEFKLLKIAKKEKQDRKDNWADDKIVKTNTQKKEASFSSVGETLVRLNNIGDVARLARTVELSRIAHGHALNARSSRSHCLVKVTITKTKKEGKTKQHFCFVDLAGSERIKKSGVTGLRANEATEINQSLSAFSHVILKISKNEKHIPYRDSTLTMLLQDAFDGGCYTSVVINVSNEIQHKKETISSLRFGDCMTTVNPKLIKNTKIIENDGLDIDKELLNEKIRKLELMKDTCGGRFHSEAVNSEKITFIKNENLLNIHKSNIRKYKIHLAEVRSTNSVNNIKRAEALLKNEQTAMEVMWGIVCRQKTIPNFYIPATARYVALEKEINRMLLLL